MDMLPQTPCSPTVVPHESINDLPVHPWTTQQIFWPTSESREFTRVDAGKVFGPNLLPADMRIPHPEMIEKQSAEIHKTRAARLKLERSLAEKAMQQKREETDRTRTVESGRFDFKFKDVSVQWVGKDGRSRRGVGWRYGMPHEDRKPGQIKIPTSA
jgi:Eukaryotic mitochondrial regulator protein